jgi:hypothetical protein
LQFAGALFSLQIRRQTMTMGRADLTSASDVRIT